MTDVRKNGDLWCLVVVCWWCRRRQCCRKGKVQAPAFDVGRGDADNGHGGGRGKGKMATEASRHLQNDVSLGRNAGSLWRRRVSWILEVSVWRCHARLPMELNESVCALNFLETGGIGFFESGEKVQCSTLSTDPASPAPRRLHFSISDFRPPSVPKIGEAALRRLLASRAIGSYPACRAEWSPLLINYFLKTTIEALNCQINSPTRTLNKTIQRPMWSCHVYRGFTKVISTGSCPPRSLGVGREHVAD